MLYFSREQELKSLRRKQLTLCGNFIILKKKILKGGFRNRRKAWSQASLVLTFVDSVASIILAQIIMRRSRGFPF